MALTRFLFLGTTCMALAACDPNQPFDFDLRDLGNGFDTSDAVRQASAPRPAPDDRGVISYPNYQVVVARRGDKIADVASRVGVDAATLARHNGISLDTPLRDGEIIALPTRVPEPSPATGAVGTGPIRPADQVDVTTLAGNAIDRAESSTIAPPGAQTGLEPNQHRVARGETAYSIARKYGVSVKDLAEWNGLGTDLSLREGQALLIPVAASNQTAAKPAAAPAPGVGSPTPVPPSAAAPLPAEKTTAKPAPAPASPDLGAEQTTSARFALPVSGPIIRTFDKSKSAFVLFKASNGTPVQAAADGTVKLVSKNADGVEILVLDHGGGLQTAYSFIKDIAVKKGQSVKRGQAVATVAQNEFGALQFMTFKGTQAVDPAPYFE
ncbi:LysM peptidoglycan-binding domain-containing protein [Aliiroseovarius sp. PTFE2010]|uniref:LysM peptidoglycan-binding domain-containing protein n=1 Tax=Aliiroseovarius sp. PTFE2010 TaxID=3417190 RepID=UPI003CFAB30B